jgi:kinase suppressor of Ras 2
MSCSVADSIDGTTCSLTYTTSDTSGIADVISTNTSNDSDKSDKTLIDTGSSSERYTALDRIDSVDSAEDLQGQALERVNSISVTLKEWDIPYGELIIGEPIGVGRFGTVYKGNWHGDVAIKELNLDSNSDADSSAQLQAFKHEVATLRKTRHENLVLFMGACMTPPKLAIITSLCKGPTLFTMIHKRKDQFQMSRMVNIGGQIAQGMGYLHAKGIIHKDLKSKNIFLESGTQASKVVITDFGLFSVTKLCQGSRKGSWLSIPPGWLCYLPPEVMVCLRAGNQPRKDLPFSNASDIYSFGTIWYELLCGEWPFKKQPPEAIIWQVGKGMKQSLTNIQASRDVKDVLMQCWAYQPSERPDFKEILNMLEKLPKKRLARSPSHPVQLSRSAESVF